MQKASLEKMWKNWHMVAKLIIRKIGRRRMEEKHENDW